MKRENINYQEFFRKEIYDRFVSFLIHKLGHSKVNELIGDEPLFTKKGVHYRLRRFFNEFLNSNKEIEKVFIQNSQQCYLQRNICEQPLCFPVNVNDDELMTQKKLRNPRLHKSDFTFTRASKEEKQDVEPWKNQVLKGDWTEKRFIAPKKLVVHFKRAYATHTGKTTVVFTVNSVDEIANLLFDLYKDQVAFAKCENQKFEFVKRKQKRRSKNEEKTEIQSGIQ